MPEQFRQVAEIPNRQYRPQIRTMVNPADVCTVVSIFPKEITEKKYTIFPGDFHIEAGTFEKPSTLVVRPSVWWKDFDPDQPILEIPVSSILVAESFIDDYSKAMVGCNMGDARPGLFFVTGELNSMEIKLKYTTKLAEVKVLQDNWFRTLIRLADSLWARGNGNPLVICDEMRMAGKLMPEGKDKPWLRDFQMSTMVPCKSCGTLKNPEFPVCPACKAIDQTHPEAKNLKFAV